MFKKIEVLAKMLELQRFTVADLQVACSVAEATIRTVINRCPVGWMMEETLVSGVKGGQTRRYSLTETGRLRIGDQLTLLPRLRPGIGTEPGGQEPPSLALARESLERLRSGDIHDQAREELVLAWRDDAWSQLQLAEDALNGAAADAAPAAMLLDLEKLRTELLKLEISRLNRRLSDRRTVIIKLPPAPALHRKVDRMEVGAADTAVRQGRVMTNLFQGFAALH